MIMHNFILLGLFWITVWTVIKWILCILGCIMLISSIFTLITDNDDESTFLYIIGGIGFVPVLFWAIIPYWAIAKWGLLILAAAVSICSYLYNRRKLLIFSSIVFILWGLTLLIAHVIVPYWNITKYIIYGLLVLATLFCLYKGVVRIINLCITARRKRLSKRLLASLSGQGIPIPYNAIFDKQSEVAAKRAIATIPSLNDQLSAATDLRIITKIKDELHFEKLKLFYNVSLRSEGRDNLKVCNEFQQQYSIAIQSGNVLDLRRDYEERNIIAKQPSHSQEKIMYWKKVLENDKLANFHNRLTKAQQMDTTSKVGKNISFLKNLSIGISSKKMEEKTNILTSLLEDTISEANELKQANQELGDILALARLRAYRNLFLSVDLVSYQKYTGGGEKLSTSKDTIANHFGNNTEELQIDTSQLIKDIDIIGDVINTGYKTTLRLMNDHKNSVGSALLVATINMAGDYLKKRAQKINQHQILQSEILQNLNTLIPSIQNGQASQLRAIELIEAIIRTNNGFLSIYVPLRDKVFVRKEQLNQEDTQALMLAASDYKKISTATL